MKKTVSAFLAVVTAFLSLSFSAFADAVTDELAPRLKEGAENYENYIDITDIVKRNGWSQSSIMDMLTCAYLYLPELFYVKNEVTLYYTYSGKYQAGFSYTIDRSRLAAARVNLENSAKKAIEGITSDMSDLEKALYIHDYIILNCRYDTAHLNYDAYDCLVTRSAVCQGYSLAYMYIMKYLLGIDCTLVYSESMQHAWNYIKINGKWYHVDLTSDDATTSYQNTSYDNLGFVMHENFLLSDAACRESSALHRGWTVIGSYGTANDTRYDDAFWRDSTSAVCFSGRTCYYAVKSDYDDGKNGKYTDIRSYDFKTGTAKNIVRIKTRWYSRRSADGGTMNEYGASAYKHVWMSLAIRGNTLYFNTNKSVYSYDLSAKQSKKIYTIDKDNNQIFGLMYIDGRIRLAYRYDTTYPERYVSLTFKTQ